MKRKIKIDLDLETDKQLNSSKSTPVINKSP